MENLDKFVDLGLNLLKKGEQRIVCPNCIERGVTNPNDKCLAVNIEKMVYHCHKCGDDYKGIIQSEAKEVEFKPFIAPDTYDLTEKAIEFFKSRKISVNTLKRFKVTADEKSIQFNFFRNGELFNVKERFPKKKFSLKKGGEVNFYNYDAINDELLLIVEGEIDALTAYECMPNIPVVSLPNGANSLSFLDQEIEKLDKVGEIVLATDGDEAGVKARDALMIRFGQDKTSFIEYPKGSKDLNEVLCNEGKEAVQRCFDNRKMMPIKAVNVASDYESTLIDYMTNGFPNGLSTGLHEIDSKIKLMLGEFVVVTGTPNSGKSTMIDYLTSLHCKDPSNNIRICVLSAENNIPVHITKLARHYLKKNIVGVSAPCDKTLEVLNYINDKYVFINAPEMEKMHYSDIIKKMKGINKRYGCNYFIIDPYNYIEKDGNDHTSHSPALRALANFAKTFNALTILVAHPKKMEKSEDGNYKYVNPYDISGSADFYNIADTIISFWRDFNSNRNLLMVQKVRNEWNGTCPSEIELEYVNGTYQTIDLGI